MVGGLVWTGEEWAMAFSAGCSAVAATCAVYVAQRDSRWRKHGLAAKLSERIARAQETAERWHESDVCRELRAEVDRQGKVLIAHGESLTSVATHSDVVRIEGAALGLEKRVIAVAHAVDRIEGILIRRALGGAGGAGA